MARDDAEVNGDTIEPPRIESIRSSRRIGPDGQIAFDLIAEVTQRRLVTHDGRTFPLYGGSTIIIGPDGDVRYAIGKSVRNKTRAAAQAAFVAAGTRFWRPDGQVYEPQAQPFRILHEPE